MTKLWLQDSMFTSREHVANVVNMGTNLTHPSVQRINKLRWKQESKQEGFQEWFECKQALKYLEIMDLIVMISKHKPSN